MMRPFSNRISTAQMHDVRAEIVRALPDAAAVILRDSNRRVPRDTGDLERSGKVVQAGPERVAVTYTDGGAVAAHEKVNIPPSDGRERKYLENAMNGTKAEVLAALVAAGKRAIR